MRRTASGTIKSICQNSIFTISIMSSYARINLSATNYTPMKSGWKVLSHSYEDALNEIYAIYCRHRGFTSVMPIFHSEYIDTSNDLIGYYDEDELVAFSMIRRYDRDNAECIQFAWDYKNPKLRLGIRSLEHECAIYKDRGWKYLYLGEADEYKKKIQGFEMLGNI